MDVALYCAMVLSCIACFIGYKARQESQFLSEVMVELSVDLQQAESLLSRLTKGAEFKCGDCEQIFDTYKAAQDHDCPADDDEEA